MQTRSLPVQLTNRNIATWFAEGIQNYVNPQMLLYQMIANDRELLNPEDLIATFTGGNYYKQVGAFEKAPLYEPNRGYRIGFNPLMYKSGFRVPDELTQWRDIGSIQKMIQNWANRLGANALQSIDLLFCNILNNGFNAAFPVYDGLPLFSASHPLLNAAGVVNNLGTPAALSESSLAAALTYFFNILDDDGLPFAMEPRYLIVPTALRLLAEQIVASASPANAPNENVASRVYNKLQVISSPKLTSSTAWFVACDRSPLGGGGHGLDLWFSPEGTPKTKTVRSEDPAYTKYIGMLQVMAIVTSVRGIYGNAGL